MHELSIAESIIESALSFAAQQQATNITQMELEIGSISGVDKAALETALEIAVRNTILQDTTFIYNEITAEGKCRHCGNRYTLPDLFTPCPSCHQYAPEIITGKELKIKSVTFDDGK